MRHYRIGARKAQRRGPANSGFRARGERGLIRSRRKSHASGLRHCRGRFGRLRAGQPADRGPRDTGGADRGRRARLEPADPHPGRVHEIARPSEPDLGLQGRGRSRHRRPRDRLPARPGAGRLVLDQRADLHPRPTRGFRPLGAARQSRLGLGRRAALFQAGRELAGRGERTARLGRVSDHLADERAAGGVPGDHRGRAGARARIPRRRQQSAAGRRRQHRLVPADPRRAAPGQRRAHLSATGVKAPQSAGRHQGAGASRAVRRQARDRRRILAQWRARELDRAGRCGMRGDPRGRRGRLAASAAIVRRRRPRDAVQGRHLGASRASRGRAEFSGPLHRPHVLRSKGHRDIERARPRPLLRQ